MYYKLIYIYINNNNNKNINNNNINNNNNNKICKKNINKKKTINYYFF